MSAAKTGTHSEGLLYALAAYGWWGLVPPVYFSAVRHVGALEVLAHRIVWSILLLGVLLYLFGRWGEFRRCLSSRRLVAALLVTTVLIAINWLVYIYGVTSRQIVQTSLGYFMNPLVNVVLGMFFFHERLRNLQWLAVALAAGGVISLTLHQGEVPWIALTLALSFGLYGMVRKTIPADGLVALSVETVLLLPLSLGYLVFLQVDGTAHFGNEDRVTDVLLFLGGVITIIPLLCFGQAARKLPLTTLGFVQYLAPTCQFLMAVFVFHEPLDLARLAAFGCIWLALGLFSVDTFLSYRQSRLAQEEAVMPVEGQG